MQTNSNLSASENRKAIQIISQQVIAEVEPEELAISTSFIEPLIDMADRDEVVAVDTSDEAGALGGADLIVIVVVPVVVTVLGNLLTKFGEIWIDKLKEKIKQDKKEAKDIIKITVGDVEAIVRRTGSVGGKRRVKELTEAISAAIIQYLENDRGKL